MNEISTANIKLIPVTKSQIFELIYATEKLEKNLALSIPPTLLDDQTRQTVGEKLNRMKNSDAVLHDWFTIWLIQPLKESQVIGFMEFKNPPTTAGKVEIGYKLDLLLEKIHWISEAMDRLCQWAFSHQDCQLITVSDTNKAQTIQILQRANFLKFGESPSNSLWHRYRDPDLIQPVNSKINFASIGTIYTSFENASGTPIQPAAAQESIGTIILNPELQKGLQDLDGFSHIFLLYVFDRIQTTKLLVKPFMDDQNRGVFATRAPARPNPIGLSIVRLISIEKNRITFSGADILNNTPLLDIKPFVPPYDHVEVVKMGWLEKRAHRLPTSKDDGRFL